MIYVAILAGGQGTRMGNTHAPKQFLPLGGKPVILHTLEKFVLHRDIAKIIVLVSDNWLNYTDDLIKTHFPLQDRIHVIGGGATRNETVMNAVEHIRQLYGLQDEDVIVTHDAVRPFISYRIIDDNIKLALQYGATDTVIPAIDTIVASEDQAFISDIPVRSNMYQGQTPQSFNIRRLLESYDSLTANEKELLTDTAKVVLLKGTPVKLVMGDNINIKITTPYDLLLANAILEGNSV